MIIKRNLLAIIAMGFINPIICGQRINGVSALDNNTRFVVYTPDKKISIDKKWSDLTKEKKDKRLNPRNTCILCPQNIVVYGDKDNQFLDETICNLAQLKDKQHTLTEGPKSSPRYDGKTLQEIISSSDHTIDLKVVNLTIEPFPFNMALSDSIDTSSAQSLHKNKHHPMNSSFFYQLDKKNIRVCPLADHTLLYSDENCLLGWCRPSNCEELYDYIAQNSKKSKK